MRYDGADGARRRRVTRQLGEAVYAALGLMVQEYLGADGAAEDFGAEVNESFDTARYLALRGEASAEEPVRETEVSRAGEAAEERSDADEAWDAAADSSEAARELYSEEPMRGSTADGADARTVRETVGAAAWRETRVEKQTVRGVVGETARSAAQSIGDGAEAFYTAARLSEEIERDARRYDGGVYLS